MIMNTKREREREGGRERERGREGGREGEREGERERERERGRAFLLFWPPVIRRVNERRTCPLVFIVLTGTSHAGIIYYDYAI